MQVTKIEDALSSITGRDTHGNRSVRLTRIPTASRSIGVRALRSYECDPHCKVCMRHDREVMVLQLQQISFDLASVRFLNAD